MWWCLHVLWHDSWPWCAVTVCHLVHSCWLRCQLYVLSCDIWFSQFYGLCLYNVLLHGRANGGSTKTLKSVPPLSGSLAAFVAKNQKCLSWAELLITSVLVGKTSSVGLGVMRGLMMVPKGASLLYGVNTGMVPWILDGGAGRTLNLNFRVCLPLLNC